MTPFDCKAIKHPLDESVSIGHSMLEEKYFELIMAVGRKYPDETRHETALRYILAAEKGTGDDCGCKEMPHEPL